MSKNKGKICISIIIFMFFLTIINFNFNLPEKAKAIDGLTVIDYYAMTYCDSKEVIYTVHPSSGAGASAVAMTFNATKDYYLSKIIVLALNYRNANIDFICKLQGTGNSLSATPNTTIYATSSILNSGNFYQNSAMASLSDPQNYYGNATFTFDSTYKMLFNQSYAFCIYANTVYYGVGPSSNVSAFAIQSGNIGTASGTAHRYKTSAWSTDSPYNDLGYSVEGTPYLNGVQPSPSPSPIPPNYNYQIAPSPNYTVYNYMTSAKINQSQNYVYTGNVVSLSTPYGSVTYNIYTTSVLDGSLNNNTIRDIIIGDLGFTTESLTLNNSGTFSLNGYGTFNFNILSNYEHNSICKYQGYKINGTIISTGEIFTSYIIIEAIEPNTDSIISVYLNGGTLTNYLLDTQLNFNQIAYNTQYNASGFVYLNGIPYTDNDSIVIRSTVISINAITVKNLAFGNNLNLVAVNGQFTFLITPQIYNAIPSYQGIEITQPTLGISTTYWIEYIGLGTTVFPTPYPTSSSSVINPTSTSSVDITQYTVLFFLVFVPPLLLAAMCYQTTQKEILKVSPVIGFFLGLCIMVPIGYLTPYNGQPLLPLWMLFVFVGGLIIAGVLIVKGMLRDVVSS